MEQALRNILEIVESAGGTATDIVRLTWYVTDKRDYLAKQREVGEAYRRVMGRHFPAMTMVVVAGLVEDAALVEIEATAVLSLQRG
jgi:enamine deaminase RidA (YjgF/YER057c/UK114 family)